MGDSDFIIIYYSTEAERFFTKIANPPDVLKKQEYLNNLNPYLF